MFTTHILQLDRRYSKRIRRIMFGLTSGLRLKYAHVDPNSQLRVWWDSGHSVRTDRFFRRILALGMASIECTY